MWLRKLDIYQKLNDDDSKRVQTYGGAILSISCLIICIFLFLTELKRFMKVDVEHIVIVDSFYQNKMDINFEIVIPRMQCRFITLRVLDKSGSQQDDVITNIDRYDLDVNGNIIDPEERKKDNVEGKCLSCGSAGEENECCNTCDDLLNAYFRKGLSDILALQLEQCRGKGNLIYVSQNRGGCDIQGLLSVNKVEGTFQVIPIKAMSVPNNNNPDAIISFLETNFNLTHSFLKFSFGEEDDRMMNPLKSKTINQLAVGIFSYFARVVPTTYVSLNNTVSRTYQYSLTEYFKMYDVLQGEQPAINVHYDLSPLRVIYHEHKHPLSMLQFLTSLCAIIGGVFTVGKIIDLAFFNLRNYAVKRRIGKSA